MTDTVMTDLNEPEKKKSIIPYYFFAFFAVVVTVNGIMIYIALSSWTGLETKNHYLKGLSYNDNLQGAEQMANLGWQKQLDVVQISGLLTKVVYELKDKEGKAITGAVVKVLAQRPTHHGYDQEVTLQETTAGVYEGPVEFPLEGQWDLRQIVQKGEGFLLEVDRFIVTKDGIK